jgi:hypothetical protein
MFSESIRNNLLLNLVSEWKLDGNTNDSWGSNNASSIIGDPQFKTETECISGTCIDLDGSDFVRMNDHSSFTVNDQMSVFLWAKSDISGVIMSQYDYGTIQRAWYIKKESEQLRVVISDNGTYDSGHIKDYRTSASVFNNEWCLVGFTFNAGTLKLYVNGKEESTQKSANPITVISIHDSTANMVIGSYLDSNSPATPFNGLIDEILLYNAVMSESQIKQNYLSGLNNLYARGLVNEIEYNNLSKK